MINQLCVMRQVGNETRMRN